MTSEAPTSAARPRTESTPAGISRSDIRIGGRPIAITPHNCFACGELNAHGLQLQLHAQDDACWTTVTLDRAFEGWDGIAHGGIVCTILDEVMAWALIERDAWGLTARMSVDFKRPARIGVPLRAEGRVVDVRRRLMRTTGRLVERESGDLVASAVGLYVAAPAARRDELKARYGFALADESPAAVDRSGLPRSQLVEEPTASTSAGAAGRAGRAGR